ncbi:helix-turn-helix domain-containing protein [Chryseobacterium camelliae]|uniref:Helix-turn-helix domain-containing protein n=1 Tax=Chryseobacterium camelliae TaxID=1265445 RepID=A0ABY7QKX1_9FLAO|nr:helix-turn-helix domain-containing protein [Chryseobacterium camelliae]WBV60277.1 helix-turn-helix domain-containing protein [Chryseobacterium camelliae]
MNNQTLPLEVRQQIEEIKNNLLPQASIPNSRLFKKIDLIEAEAVLQYAKSMNKPVRRANATECEFVRNIQKKEREIESPTDYLTRSQAAEIIGMKESTILFYHRKGMVTGTKIKRQIYFDRTEIYRFKAARLYKNYSS